MDVNKVNEIITALNKELPNYAYTVRYWSGCFGENNANGFESNDVFTITIRERVLR